MKGSRFYKADLHIHTPASRCYQDKGIAAKEIVEQAVKKGLQVIAITDHNDVSFIEEIQRAAKGKDLTIFPGLEITATNAHILGIFDSKHPIKNLGDLLTTVGITSDKRGMKDAIAKDAEIVIREITNFGGIAIAPHANSSNGILKHHQGTYKSKIYRMTELLAMEFNDRDDVEKFCMGAIPQYPAKACVMGSDAHSLSEIGSRFTYFKMDTISLNSLKLTLLDHEVKIKFPWDDVGPHVPMVKTFSVNKGFFLGEAFDFHPNLNCLVGGKGTGKSTVIELMRYCFDDISNIEDVRADTKGKVRKLVGEGGTVETVFQDENGEEYTIQREVIAIDDPFASSQSVILDKDGQESFFSNKPIFFSQGEIARIATSPIAQLELLNRYVDLHEEEKNEKDLIEKLKTNRAILIEKQQKYESLILDILDPETGKLATKAEHDRFEKELKNPIFIEFPKWELEERFIKSQGRGLESLATTVRNSLQEIDVESLFGIALESESPNFTLLSPILNIGQNYARRLESIREGFEQEVEKTKSRIEEIGNKWQPLFNAKKKEYEEFVGKLGEATIVEAQRKFRRLKIRLEEIKKKEGEAAHFKKDVEKFKKERESLLEKLSDVRTKRFQKRVEKSKEWEKKFSGEIKIDLERSGDKKDYLSELKNLLYGSRIYEKDLQTVVQTIDPEKLSEACLSDQIGWLVEHSMVREDIIRRMVEYIKTREMEKVFDLQIVNLQDLIQISFQVEPGKYKPLNELSVGTKSTVIVSLAMIEGKSPLVIDQPEDSL